MGKSSAIELFRRLEQLNQIGAALSRERDEMESRWIELSESREAKILAFERGDPC